MTTYQVMKKKLDDMYNRLDMIPERDGQKIYVNFIVNIARHKADARQERVSGFWFCSV